MSNKKSIALLSLVAVMCIGFLLASAQRVNAQGQNLDLKQGEVVGRLDNGLPQLILPDQRIRPIIEDKMKKLGSRAGRQLNLFAINIFIQQINGDFILTGKIKEGEEQNKGATVNLKLTISPDGRSLSVGLEGGGGNKPMWIGCINDACRTCYYTAQNCYCGDTPPTGGSCPSFAGL